ncbi:hypothetical protein CNBG_10014 [Cryptococcus deuterogattii R265]|uniref:uncharacterized protein n=1 Tax=Cryptococcus deuterogattii (strain R265) TaxID=294750 RepID=UPI0005B5D2E9|nr:hypothetical protein I310_06529 [Cryptococcus deuterogattii CA1014]QPK66802.1 hypothetical protein CNBG_10014 [Cryptococcus deuterogattii R265]
MSIPAFLSLAGRTAIVSGSSSGFGRSIALRLGRLGCTVICADRQPQPNSSAVNPSDTHELIVRNGGQGFYYPLDVTELEGYRGAVKLALEQSASGRLDIMVNNAGVGGHAPDSANLGIHTEAEHFAKRVVDVNLMGVWNGTKVAVEQMLEQEPEPFPADLDANVDLGDVQDARVLGGERGSRGTIINVASLHGMVAGPWEPAYSASKAAVINLSRTVAADYAPHRINCNSLSPGYSAADMNGKPLPLELRTRRVTPWPHQGAGRDIANGVIYLARDAPWVTGSNLVIDGGTTCI